MTIQTFPDTTEGQASAAAVPEPKHIWITPRGKIVVFTGVDIPDTSIPVADITLSKWQLMTGILTVGGQVKLNAANAYIRGIVGVDAKDLADQIAGTGTPAQKVMWSHCDKFTRGMVYINQLRVGSGLTNNEMDDVFRIGVAQVP
ncbi:MAG: hypothetical protein IPG87_19490 [Saprospiraceae bacterium]|nr:hypothetical protein [Candidatus Vicinibacter affinis]